MTTTVFAMKMEEFYHVTEHMKVTKKLCNLKKKRIKCLNFMKIHCDLSIFHRQLFFDVSVGGEGVYTKSRNEEFPKRPFSNFPPIKNFTFREKQKNRHNQENAFLVRIGDI